MKKTYIILLFVVLGVVTVNAQGIRYGVTGGINLHTTSGDVDTEGVLVGYYAGVKSIYDFLEEGMELRKDADIAPAIVGSDAFPEFFETVQLVLDNIACDLGLRISCR